MDDRPNRFILKDLIKVSADYLAQKTIPSARLNAEILLAHELKVERMALYLNFDQPVSDSELEGFRNLIRRRVRGEPLQYITGVQEFWSLEFLVDKRVLIPRPESELLVELSLDKIKDLKTRSDNIIRVLEIGTGSGAISISLAKELSDIKIYATDVSECALEVAVLNAKKHGVEDNIEFLKGDLWTPVEFRKNYFDIIISNPPYISMEEFSSLPKDVRDFEPEIALNGHEEGMFYINSIISRGHDFLKQDGWIFLEMAPAQTKKTLDIITGMGHYEKSLRVKDYSRLYRIVLAQKRISVNTIP